MIPQQGQRQKQGEVSAQKLEKELRDKPLKIWNRGIKW